VYLQNITASEYNSGKRDARQNFDDREKYTKRERKGKVLNKKRESSTLITSFFFDREDGTQNDDRRS
jgi:hypothetical protein